MKDKKRQLREEVKKQSLNLDQAYKLQADADIIQKLIDLPEYRLADTVFCFVGMEHEINTRPFLQKVLDDKKRLTVPLCVGKRRMEARQIHSLNELKSGQYGILEPDNTSLNIPVNEIGLAIIPCITTDRMGNRLGHGGGYYDTLFGQYPDIPAVIICREQIIREDIPLESFDHRFCITVTEAGVFRRL